jgi:hypothetical protein
MNQSARRLRETASRLATLFESEEGERVLKLMTQLAEPERNEHSRPPEIAAEAKTELADESDPVRVGTWQATIDAKGRSFVRVQMSDPWHLWANVQRIPPKSRRRRILLVGESVARGLLYDPHFNPALALQEILSAACGPSEIEVIDLARTDLTHEPLQKLISSAMVLEPDALVVFASNNWHPLASPTADELFELAAALRENDSWRGVKQFAESSLTVKAEQTLRSLGEIISRRGIPVVFVVPEFNLADWRTECYTPPLLDNNETASWLRIRREAEELLNGDRWASAEGLGLQLMQMDEGTTAAGPNIVAEVKRRRGDHAAARIFFEMGRDASVCWPFMISPRCFSVIQEVVRSRAATYGIRVVDLPYEFGRYLGGEVPGRRLFLDYCHLSLEGIRVSMALVAEALLPLLSYPCRPWKKLSEVDLKVSDKVAAEAHFLAAVHNANWGQGIDIVRHHCRSAIESSRGIARMMQIFLDLHIRRVPTGLCRSFDQLCELKNAAAINLLYNHLVHHKFLNTTLVTAVAEVLEEFDIPARACVNDLVIKEHAVKARGLNLLDTIYATRSFARSLVDLRPGFYKAMSWSTTFPVVCEDSRALHFTITLKVPGAGLAQTVSLSVNGTPIVEIPATNAWTTSTFSAPAQMLHPGFNQIEIQWPMPVWSGKEWRTQVIERLEAGRVVEITPVFGLIHSFRVSLTPSSAQPSTQPLKLKP